MVFFLEVDSSKGIVSNRLSTSVSGAEVATSEVEDWMASFTITGVVAGLLDAGRSSTITGGVAGQVVGDAGGLAVITGLVW